MLSRLRQTSAGYPRSFWLLFWGMLISRSGSSMVWPFLTIYLRQRLDIPLTMVALLLTANSAAGLLAISVAGPVVDRFGRKRAMVIGMLASSAVLLGMSRADDLGAWVVLMVTEGAAAPLYVVGTQSMVADLISAERRAGAYALLRMIANLGVAIGPSVGGFVAAQSYTLAFYIGAAAELAFALLVLVFVGETVPKRARLAPSGQGQGYAPVLRDRPFLMFCAVYTLSAICYSLMMILLPVYAKENFGVPENQYGFIMATNAALVVLLQFGITRRTERYPHLHVLTVGTLFYALGVGSVAWGWNFPTFLVSMVVLTIGEMIMVPTSMALTANLAPVEMRGRYMGLYSLTWNIGFGVGPVLGGLLNDRLAPVAIWYGGLILGLVGAAGFALLGRGLHQGGLSQQQPPG